MEATGHFTLEIYFYNKSGAKGDLVITISASFYVSADSFTTIALVA